MNLPAVDHPMLALVLILAVVSAWVLVPVLRRHRHLAIGAAIVATGITALVLPPVTMYLQS